MSRNNRVLIAKEMLDKLPTSVREDIKYDLDLYGYKSKWDNVKNFMDLAKMEENKREFIMNNIILQSLEQKLILSGETSDEFYSSEEIVSIMEDYFEIMPKEESTLLEGLKTYFTGEDDHVRQQLYIGLPNFLQNKWEIMHEIGFSDTFIGRMSTIDSTQRDYLLKKMDKEMKLRIFTWEDNKNILLASVELEIEKMAIEEEMKIERKIERKVKKGGRKKI